MKSKRVVLVGLMGSGKTSVGRRLAAQLDLEFVDTDEAISAQTGRTPAEIIEESGEPYFRQIERDVVLGELARPGSRVLALGGGAFVDPEIRRTCGEEPNRAVYLVTPADVAAQRAAGDVHVVRPLLVGDANERMAALLRRRAAFYEEAAIHVSTDGRDVDAIVEDLVRRLGDD